MKKASKAETPIQSQIRLALGSRADTRPWRNNVGVDFSKGTPVAYGLCVGSADLICITRGGLFLAVEAKSKNGRQSKEQKDFQKVIEKLGGIYILGRSDDQVIEDLELSLKEKGL